MNPLTPGRERPSLNLEDITRNVTSVINTVHTRLATLERAVGDVLDKQITVRLINRYDHLLKAGFSEQEALEAVMSLVRRRLEVTLKERAENAG